MAEHPDFTEGLQRPERWLILPVESSITRGRLTDAEPLIKETKAIEQALTHEVERALVEGGYEVDIHSLSVDALSLDEGLDRATGEVRSRAFELLAQAGRDAKGIARGRFSIADAGLPLAAATGANGLVIVQSRSLIVSKGNKALAAVLNPFNLVGATRTRTELLVALLDLRDGQLLAVLTGGDIGAVLKNPEEVARQVVDSAFRQLPAHDRAQAAKRKFREQAPARDLRPVPQAEGPASDEVLTAFEEVASEWEGQAGHPEPGGSLTPESEAPAASPAPGQGVEAAASEEVAPSEAAATGREAGPSGTSATSPEPVGEAAGSLRDMFDSPPEARPEPELQVVFLGEPGPTALRIRNMAREPSRVSIGRRPWRLLPPGESLDLPVEPGSHQILVAAAEVDRELARAAVIAGEGRIAIVELWPRGE